MKMFAKQENVNLFAKYSFAFWNNTYFRKILFQENIFPSFISSEENFLLEIDDFLLLVPLIWFHKKRWKGNAVNLQFRAKSLQEYLFIFLIDILQHKGYCLFLLFL